MIPKEIKEYKQGTRHVQRINILKNDNLKGKVYVLEIKEYEGLISEIKRLTKTIETKGNELKQQSEVTDKLRETINDLNQELEEKNKIKSKLTAQIKNENNEMITLKNKIVKNELNIKTLQKTENKLNQVQNDMKRTDNENEHYISENRKLLEEKKDLENKIKNLEAINKTFKEVNQDKDQTIKELNKENIQQLKESYDKFNEELKKYITVNQLQNTALKQILELGFMDLIRNKHKKIANENLKELKEDKKVYELTEKK
jgi:DNA repair exonuclease SbcCD ATPase subunit